MTTGGSALRFIILLGIVSLFADITYEGARSIIGPYLGSLGANAVVVGVVAGLGEFVGYGFRFVSGYISDKTRQYWLITIIGYLINQLSIPLMALAGTWQVACVFVVLERFGKAIRYPARDAMISYATKEVGAGRSFGIHNALDQTGAVLGPLAVAAFLFYQESYQVALLCLALPAFCCLGTLLIARLTYPEPEKLESLSTTLAPQAFTPLFWLYIVATGLLGAGFVDFALIAYHFHQASILSTIWIPLLYAVAMGTQGLASYIFGRTFDRKGIIMMVYVTGVAAASAPLVFLGGFYPALLGMVLWGIGIGAQSTVMRAVIATIIPAGKRGTGFGVLNLCFGLSWFLGSALMGYLYTLHPLALVAFSIASQLAAIPIFLIIKSK